MREKQLKAILISPSITAQKKQLLFISVIDVLLSINIAGEYSYINKKCDLLTYTIIFAKNPQGIYGKKYIFTAKLLELS